MRPLKAAERALLDHLLVPEFKGVEALRAQAASAEVVVQDEFPWSIELHVQPTAPPAIDVYRNPVTGTFTADPSRPGASITLWLNGDYLGRIEMGWMEDEPWPDLPTPSQLEAAALIRPLG